jgi:transcriptional regulator with XRE-family HTH domain
MQTRAIENWEEKADLLRKCRQLAGLTVEEVAADADLDRTTISTYESRRARPSANALERWETAVIGLVWERLNHAKTALNDLRAGFAG